jgi:hypothetical protein
MFKKFKNQCKELKKAFAERDLKPIFAKIGLVLLLLAFVFAVVALIAFAFVSLCAYLNQHMDNIIRVLIVAGAVAIPFIYRKNKTKGKAEAPQPSKPGDAVQERARANYELLKGWVFSLLTDDIIRQTLSISVPSRLSQIETSRPFSIHGETVHYNFVAMMASRKHDAPAIKEILNTRLRQKLRAKEFGGLLQEVVALSNGSLVPVWEITDVRIAGETVAITAVLASDVYANQKSPDTLDGGF